MRGARVGRAGMALGALAALGLAAGMTRGQGRAGSGPPQKLPVTARWCLGSAPVGSAPVGSAGGRCIGLEVADDPREQAWGLQMRARLPAWRGMWFPYPIPTPVRFWMHRTPEPLDMIFLRGGRVIAIETALPCMRLPCRNYGPDGPVDGVVELAAGEAKRLGIQVGSRARIEPVPPPANVPVRGRTGAAIPAGR